MIPLKECKKKEIDAGFIFIGPSDEHVSEGYLELKPGAQLARHNRPVDEELLQIVGESEIILDNEKRKLQRGERLMIPANNFHIHKNPGKSNSLTYWKFEGDVTKIISGITDS